MQRKKIESWTEREEAFLRDNYETMTHAGMAKELGRTTGAVRSRCSKLKLKKKIDSPERRKERRIEINREWEKRNRAEATRQNYRRSARTFIRNHAEEGELKELEQLILIRREELKRMGGS